MHCAVEKTRRLPTRTPLISESEKDALRIKQLKQELNDLKPKRSDRRAKLFQEMYTDLKLFDKRMYGGGKVVSLFIDRESGELWVTLLKSKDEWVSEASRDRIIIASH